MVFRSADLAVLRRSIQAYAPINDVTWQAIETICRPRYVPKGALLYRAGVVPTSFAYILQGLVRCFSTDDNGNEYNKIFFDEGMFPGAMTALLTAAPSALAFEAIEDSHIIDIDFAAYRALLQQHHDLALFQIAYLEKNWLLAKDAREVALVQTDATARYLAFIEQYPALATRLPQYHIASHLGVTPTQLSRIRKSL